MIISLKSERNQRILREIIELIISLNEKKRINLLSRELQCCVFAKQSSLKGKKSGNFHKYDSVSKYHFRSFSFTIQAAQISPHIFSQVDKFMV